MHYKNKLLATILMSSGIISSPLQAWANDSSELEQLRALVQELDQKVKILERKGELADEATTAAKKETPVVRASSSGFGLESADGKNSIKLRGIVQADYRYYDQGANDIRARSNQRAGDLDINGFHDANGTWLLRRVRPTIEGTLFGKYDYRFTPDFAGGSATVVDAYIDARFDPAFKVRVGKFKSFVGLERLQSASDIKFLERSYVTNAILPNRDLGIAAHGDLFANRLNYAIGYNNGVSDGGNISTGAQFDQSQDFTGRLFATPFIADDHVLRNLGFGLGATFGTSRGERNLNFTDTSAADATRNGLPSYVTNGQQTFFRYSSAAIADGARFRLAPQANYYWGPFGVIAEYALVSQDVSLTTGGSPAAGGAGSNTAITPNTNKTLTHDAWQIAASYLITGEDASFRGVKPKQDFDLSKGGWGAWELVARYSELNLDKHTFRNPTGTSYSGGYADLSQSARSARSWTAGVNWYLNANAKIALNYEYTSFDGGAISGNGITGTVLANGSNVRDRPDEQALLTRFQVSF